MDENCHVPDCWDYKKRKFSSKLEIIMQIKIEIYKDYNNNDE
jgi:hypothetical protein